MTGKTPTSGTFEAGIDVPNHSFARVSKNENMKAIQPVVRCLFTNYIGWSQSQKHGTFQQEKDKRCSKLRQHYRKANSSPRRRVPRRILNQLSRMPVQSHDTLQDQIRDIQHREPAHIPLPRELAPDLVAKVNGDHQRAQRREQKPLRHGVLEEDQVCKLGPVAREVGDDERE